LLYFRDVIARPARLRRIVPLSHFARDLAAGMLPDFSLVVPDLCHDMHDCPVATGDAWLRRFLRPLLGGGALRDGVVFVVFDEDDGAGGDHVAALALGPLVRPGSSSRQRLDHYALLRTIEDGLGLPRLGRSASGRAITGIWRSISTRRLLGRPQAPLAVQPRAIPPQGTRPAFPRDGTPPEARAWAVAADTGARLDPAVVMS
jgi:phosphoesterase family protein